MRQQYIGTTSESRIKPEAPVNGNGHRLSELPPVSPVVVSAADIEPREVRWLWPGRIPLARLTLLVGVPGIGKSYLTADIASRISTGTPWPDGSECEPGSTLLVSAEDDPADTTRPRLDAHHADVASIHFLRGVRFTGEDGRIVERVFTLADLPALEHAMKSITDLRLVVIDPIGSYVGGDIDSHRDTEVRSVLAPVAALAEKYGPAVVVVAHRPKGYRPSADEAVMGSRAFTGIARAVWHLCRDHENRNRRLLLPGKQNLSREASGLAFTLAGEPVAAVCWEKEPIDLSADEGLAAEQESDGPGRPADERREAEGWLHTELADLAEHPVKALKQSATELGYSWSTVKRAATAIRVIRSRGSFAAGGIWRLPRPGKGTSRPRDQNYRPDGPEK